MASEHLDFDGEPLRLVEDAHTIAKNQQQVRDVQYKRDYQNLQGFVDMTKRNPDQVHVFVPKTFNIIETKVPRNVKGAIGMRPFIPFEANRRDFRDQSQLHERVLDTLLEKASFDERYEDSARIKTPYGTSFIEAIPYYTEMTEKVIVPDMLGQPQMQERSVLRLRLKVKVYAPWDVFVDPYATGLEHREDCRYLIKRELVSRRQLLELAQQGAYPGLDIEELERNDTTDGNSDDWGQVMLADIGIPSPQMDDDMGVLLRYESPDRYIDIWNGRVVLRDIPNPYKHKKINLSRHKHTGDYHTGNLFWGIGECKPNEILQAMLNSTWNQTFNNHQIHNQPVTYYRLGSVNPDALVRTSGNKVGIGVDGDRPLRDYVEDAPVHGLPRDHYLIPGAVERMMDFTSGVYDMQRGEEAQRTGTASEAAMRQQAGDIKLEREIRQSERFLADFGGRCLSHIEQFATMEDFTEILGAEGAQRLMFRSPQDIPGGHNYTFKGSTKVAQTLLMQRNVKEMMPFWQNSPNVMQGKLMSWVMPMFEMPQSMIEEVIIPDEAMMQMQQQAAEQEFQKEMALAEAGHKHKLIQDREKMQMQGEIRQQAQGASKKEEQTTQKTAESSAKASVGG